MMKDFKSAMATDLERIKHLDLDIIPARTYYKHLFLGWFLLFVLILMIQFAACFFAMSIHSWDYAPNIYRYNSIKNMDEFHYSKEKKTLAMLKDAFPNASKEKLKQLFNEEETQWKEGEWNQRKELLRDHKNQVIYMWLSIFFTSLCISLYGVRLIKNYIIFKYQISPKLQTGPYLVKKIHWAAKLCVVTFAILAFIIFPILPQGATFFSVIPCFFGALIVTSIAINMEASRIGLSVLSKAISNFFQKEKEGVR
ncbi:hypothetical protein OQJ05_16785 [Fluoribacter gormanii]|uniref:hypothetical protein n=1 Tax=Fluoribacter gormanii TaxID=464 RepID=UPI002244DA07|nr:hypothetical protein [Fluoribacter gormanii]MCW8445692.1 hypothetical protein [Fluoribacter gormanii]